MNSSRLHEQSYSGDTKVSERQEKAAAKRLRKRIRNACEFHGPIAACGEFGADTIAWFLAYYDSLRATQGEKNR